MFKRFSEQQAERDARIRTEIIAARAAGRTSSTLTLRDYAEAGSLLLGTYAGVIAIAAAIVTVVR